MRVLVLLSLSVVLLAQSSASSSLIFSDYFYSNSKKWSTGYTNNYEKSVSNGKYKIKYKGKTGNMSWKRAYINTSKDFQIEAKIRWLAGVENNGIGVAFGVKDASDAYMFNISANGYYRYAKFENGTYKAILPWKTHKSINKGYAYNKLKVRKVGTYLYFYINDKYVSSSRFTSFFGQNIGFHISNRQTFEVDYITVKYINKKSTYTSTKKTTSKKKSQMIFENYFYMNKSWKANKDKGGRFSIKNGKLNIQSYNDYNYTAENYIYINTSRNFSIETEATWSSGVKNYYFGVAFGRKSDGSSYSFAITANGKYNFFEFDNYKYKSLKSGSSGAVKLGNRKNVLKVSKSGNYLYFYVNNKYITSHTFKTFYGHKIGLEVYGKQVVNFNQIKIKYTDNKSSNNYTYTQKSNSNYKKPSYSNSSANQTKKGQSDLLVAAEDNLDFLEENFKNNFNDWPKKDTYQTFAKRGLGNYILEHKKSSGRSLIFPPSTFDFELDYEIESTVSWRSGIKNHGYGLIFEHKDSDNNMFFVITGSGQYLLGKTKNGVYKNLINWTKDPIINRGMSNTLKIIREKDSYHLYINDKHVNKIKDELRKPLGNQLGLVVYNEQKVAYQNLEFKLRKANTQIAKSSVDNKNSLASSSIVENKATEDFFDELATNLPKSNVDNSNSIAVIIGIDKYANKSVPEVKYAKNDARLIRKYLIDVLGYSPENILPQDDSALMTVGTMKTLLKQVLPSYLRPDGSSKLFVYYSGHGAPSTTTQAAYFVPYDADPNFVNDFNAYDMTEFYKDIKGMKAAQKTIVIDACFSGLSGNGKMLIQNASPTLLKVKSDQVIDEKTVLFQSSQSDQVSNWYPEKRHGMFTYFFLKGLRGDADINKDKVVTMKELSNFINNANSGLPYFSNRKFQRPQKANISGNLNQNFIKFK